MHGPLIDTRWDDINKSGGKPCTPKGLLKKSGENVNSIKRNDFFVHNSTDMRHETACYTVQ